MHKSYDIAIVGGGRSGVKTFCSIIDKLKSTNKNFLNGIEIAFIHDSEILGGLAYSPETSPLPLPFHQALYNIEKNNEFSSWLQSNIFKVLSFIGANKDKRNQRWLNENAQAYIDNNIGEKRLPRAVYGLYLQEKFCESLNDAKELGINVNVIKARATDPSKTVDDKITFAIKDSAVQILQINKSIVDAFTYYKLSPTENINLTSIDSKYVAWFPGMMPNPYHADIHDDQNYIRTLYNPELGNQFTKIEEKISTLTELSGKKITVTIGGSGASAMDLITWLSESNQLDKIEKINVIASKSSPRIAATESGSTNPYTPIHFTKENLKINSCEDITAYITDEYKNGLSQGYTYPEIAKIVHPNLIKSVDNFNKDEQFLFYDQMYGVLYFEYFTFDSKETVGAWDKLSKSGKINVINDHIEFDNAHRMTDKLAIKTIKSGTVESDIYVNCMGNVAKKKSDYNNPDLNPCVELIEGGLAQFNQHGKGLVINKNCQLIGKDGNINNIYTSGFVVSKSIAHDGYPGRLTGLGSNIDENAAIISESITSKLLSKFYCSPCIKIDGITPLKNNTLKFI